VTRDGVLRASHSAKSSPPIHAAAIRHYSPVQVSSRTRGAQIARSWLGVAFGRHEQFTTQIPLTFAMRESAENVALGKDWLAG